MSDNLVFGDIIADEISSASSSNFTTYELMAPYYNPKLEKGEFFISTSNKLYYVTPAYFPHKIGNINLSVQLRYGEYITVIASFIPKGPTGPINSQIIISKPTVIKSKGKVQPQTTQDGLVPVNQPFNVSQAPSPSPQLINFNVGTGGVVLVSSAFAVLLIMLYRQWSANKLKGDKV